MSAKKAQCAAGTKGDILMKKIQFGTETVIENEKNNGCIILKYYLLETPVGFGYSKLKSYGIGITRIDRKPGQPDMRECKQIEGVYFDAEEAVSVIAKMKKEAVLPTQLSYVLERVIAENIKIQREKRISEMNSM